MTFLFDANCSFEAADLDDALSKLAKHFGYLQDPESSGLHELEFVGSIRLDKE